MRVLIVDDNSANLYLLQTLLPAYGYTVESATDGLEAKGKLVHAEFDLIISDILMPRMDGFQLCREVKSDPRWRETPFIFYTATYTSEQDREFALKLGADHFIVKPQEPEVFLEMLRQVLNTRAAGGLEAKAAVGEDEPTYLKEYSERLIQKLERKMIQLEQEKERYRITVASISDGIVTIDKEGRVTYLNPAAAHLTGWAPDEAIGQPLTQVCPLVREDPLQAPWDPMQHYLHQTRDAGMLGPFTLARRDGEEATLEITVSPLLDHQRAMSGLVLALSDLTEKRKLIYQLSYQAAHDALTQLVNRREFERRLDELLVRGNGTPQHALLYADLDQFKVINDTCGHVAGDELLKQICKGMRAVVRKRDTLARLGGDEFGVLMEDCAPEQAMRAAGELLRMVNGFRFDWNGSSYTVGVSIGVVAMQQAGETPLQIMGAADAACYAAKAKGRNCIHVYQPDDLGLLRRQGEISLFWGYSNRRPRREWRKSCCASSTRTGNSSCPTSLFWPRSATIRPRRWIDG